MKKIALALVAFLLCISVQAQRIWRADVQQVQESGYYNIEVDSKLVGATDRAFKNLRLYLEDGEELKEMPYVVQAESPVQAMSNFIDFEEVSQSAKDSINTCLFKTADKGLSRAYIQISSVDANIDATIYGGNDGKQWFLIKKSSKVLNIAYGKGEGDLLVVDFPTSNYTYYKVVLNNHATAPLHILRVGNISSHNIFGQFQKVDLMDMQTHTDKEKKRTVISFPNLEHSYAISKVVVQVPEEYKYLRRASLKSKNEPGVVYFNLKSDTDNTIYSNAFKVDSTALLSIENGDNPPLTIGSVEAYTLRRYICAHLKAGAKYRVEVDGRITKPAHYDLEQLSDLLPKDIATVATHNVQFTDIPLDVRKPMLLENPVVMWCIILCIGLFLFTLSASMLKKLKDKK